MFCAIFLVFIPGVSHAHTPVCCLHSDDGDALLVWLTNLLFLHTRTKWQALCSQKVLLISVWHYQSNEKRTVFSVLNNSSNQIMFGQVEKAEVRKPKYGNGSTESEVRSEKKSGLSVFSAFLSHECGLRPCRQKGGQSLQCESRIFGCRTAASVAITNCAMCT